MWVGETIADVIGYPLAGLFVAFLGGAAARVLARRRDLPGLGRPAGTIVVRPRTGDGRRGGRRAEPKRFLDELKAGWRFLRSETVLLANTIQAAIAQFTVGCSSA